ncbi:hypothetical protein AS9A_P20029 (plasmid) [Hoyosella subflava DQS3-9A1]|uniref:Uncharacterized protein n=1 Tax=Hoyosella subflava (strain DSM 45089 / JCM 17490 / NBRC 109087 / DQS3-9A1) TaxID=443218 RepID=F6ESF2_HOYSD|nr:hypothetical protein AS9A_P20029 [Hoyosella subflava DQS3-9A1]
MWAWHETGLAALVEPDVSSVMRRYFWQEDTSLEPFSRWWS